MTITEASRITGLSTSRVQQIVDNIGRTVPAMPLEDIVHDIQEEQRLYISFSEYAAQERGRYTGDYKSKGKLLDNLEVNDYYGIEITEPDDLLIGTRTDRCFFRREDIPTLDRCLAEFFGSHAKTEDEKVKELLGGSKNRKSVKCLRSYFDKKLFGKQVTPLVTEFVRAVLEMPELISITDRDIILALSKIQTEGAKRHLVEFLAYARKNESVKYGKISMAERDSNPLPAYSNEVYLKLARCIFNADYIAKHRMIERALENHIYIEMWLFLALHYVSGQRAEDICRNWSYLNLSKKPSNTFGIKVDTLYEDILYDRLPDELYENVCKYVLSAIKASGARPSKTCSPNAPTIHVLINPGLYPFFGLLTLISEAVMLRTGDGYMQPKRTASYQCKTKIRDFFGQEMYDALGGKNIRSRQLNKDYLQSVEDAARKDGCGSLMASMVASYARSHTNMDTVKHYLNDHTLTAETAEMVLYFAMERGVFGFMQYTTILLAYPDAFPQLPMSKQSELMNMLKSDPLYLEIAQSETFTQQNIRQRFLSKKDPKNIVAQLQEMLEISQNRGKGKDDGIYCTRRALGEACTYPEYRSCLANACPYLVFTKIGFSALLGVFRDYIRKAYGGDRKSEAVLRNVILPRFKGILTELGQNAHMTHEEMQTLKAMIKEAQESEKQRISESRDGGSCLSL